MEAKLFGIGAESYTAGSAEFYMGYAVSRQKLLTLDAGHYHPTEMISEKISSVLLFCPGLLLHVSRPVRWDSDHVVILDDELIAIAKELVRSGKLDRIHLGLDYFDASINRVAAWVIGTRNMLKALLIALLEPTAALRRIEGEMDFTQRLMLLEEIEVPALERRCGTTIARSRVCRWAPAGSKRSGAMSAKSWRSERHKAAALGCATSDAGTGV